MKGALRQIGAVVLGVVVSAALIGGCALYERGKDLLPGPARALVDSLDSAGLMGFTPVDFSAAGAESQTSPLDACPDYAADVERLARAVQGDLTAESAGGDAIASLLAVQVDRLQAGGTPDAPSVTDVDVALARQNGILTGAATRLRTTAFDTQQVASLAVSLAAALEAVVKANDDFLAGGTGVRTRSAWMNWATRAGGPYQQVEAVMTALSKCPA